MWRCPVYEAQCRCSAEEYFEWIRRFPDEPWGDLGADLRVGYSTMALLAAHGVKRPRIEHVLPWLVSDVETDWAAREAQIAAVMAVSGVPVKKVGASDGG